MGRPKQETGLPTAKLQGIMRLLNKSAIVTGAAQGLGEALARRLALEGCDVLLADINLDKARLAADAIERETGRRTGATQTNVASETDVREMVDEAVRAFGKLDILVANTGIVRVHDIAEFPLSEWQAVIDINLTGYFLCAQAAARAMIPNRSGAIIQINSHSGKNGLEHSSAYAACMFGGIGLTQSLALDLAPHKIRINAVCPSTLTGEVHSTYEDIANTVIHLASDDASDITGQALTVPSSQGMR